MDQLEFYVTWKLADDTALEKRPKALDAVGVNIAVDIGKLVVY